MSTDSSAAELVLSSEQRRTMFEEASRTHPSEACGLILGVEDHGRLLAVRTAVVPNAIGHGASRRFRIRPRDWIRLDREARREGLRIVGIWHSHPRGEAAPSESDRQGAWEEYLYVIAAPEARIGARLRCWRLEGGVFHEVELS